MLIKQVLQDLLAHLSRLPITLSVLWAGLRRHCWRLKAKLAQHVASHPPAPPGGGGFG